MMLALGPVARRSVWSMLGVGGVVVAGAAGCGSPSPAAVPSRALSTTVVSTNPSAPTSPVQLNLAPDPTTRTLTYTVTNTGTTPADVSVQFAAGGSELTLTPQRGSCQSGQGDQTICHLGTLAPRDNVSIIAERPSRLNVVRTPNASCTVQDPSGTGTVSGSLPETAIDWTHLPAATVPPAVDPAALAGLDMLRLPAASVAVSAPPMSGGAVTREKQVKVSFTNTKPTATAVRMGLDVVDGSGTPQPVEAPSEPSQGRVQPGEPPDPPPASPGLTWDMGTVPAGATESLMLKVRPSGGGRLELRGDYELASSQGTVRGALVRPLQLPPATAATASRAPSASRSPSPRGPVTGGTATPAPVTVTPAPPAPSSETRSPAPSPVASPNPSRAPGAVPSPHASPSTGPSHPPAPPTSGQAAHTVPASPSPPVP